MSLCDISNKQNHGEGSDEDDVPTLSADTFKALQEFYAECEAVANKKIDENWQLSQFWYDKKTSETLAKEVLTNAVNYLKQGESFTYSIGCISCPTLFKTLHDYLNIHKQHSDIENFEQFVPRINLKLFEYDKRFGMYGEDFEFYDYKNPLDVNPVYENYFDLIISDPPYLSQECHIKTGMTVRKVGKKEALRLIICTGAIMEELLAASLRVKLVSFVPRHERNLANEFKCYANYETLFLNQ